MSTRKLIPFLALTVVLFVLFLYQSTTVRDTWRGLPQHVGLGEHIGDDKPSENQEELPQGQQKDPDYVNWNPKPNFTPGSAMPPGHNYSSVLVIAKTKEEDTTWMDREIPDQEKAIYVADDPTAPLHPPKNKGHEVMVYLSWIIDNYDNLPDVAIFMHAHQLTWHNDDILDNNAAILVKSLSRQRVWREGFMNMRCSWYPGCPDWMHPGETEENAYKQEEVLLAKSWSELFPLDPVPAVLAQPCCAQFALSRERIQAKPHSQYVWYREWLFSTKLPDYLSGRIWEYVWQFVFTGNNVFCPEEHICFCDGFGMCFGGKQEYDDFTKVKNELHDRENDLREWEDKKKAIEEAKEEGRFEEANQLEVPEPGKDQEFKKEIERIRPIVDKLKNEARERGKDPKNRAKETGREWHDGDDF
ncbi:uncharacterized protein BDR25DRAFT_300532 [Lindgomyces ingoldianus]|uniref:Uncharacterized protein n=1 Tax=Lindgomyces ingoldianus TaxID=673940 RepID=A0ACB6RCV4_9PLEO|nr:uncharacterized protein BDR25DRAFT_300532 [Lindgomyces ingoldianus]KAF2476588.1 hypothetical protein BDR25DRAFT_300532 [Lindgomyces ingoldianus]